MPSPAIELVCFDLGRVLIRISDDWQDACRRAGVPCPPQLHDPQVLDAAEKLTRQHESGRIDVQTFDQAIAELTDLSVEQVHAVVLAWLGEPFDDVDELVERVAAAPVRTACLSNTNDRHWRMMSGDGDRGLPVEHLDFRFVSHHIGAAKPDAAIYEHVESQSQISPERILFFDDHPPNIAAARRRGWCAQQITTDRTPVVQMTEHLQDYGIL